MPVSLALLLTAGVLITCGVYLFLERTLTRVLLGFILTGNGVNLLFLVATGKPGKAPFQGEGSAAGMSDPLPFAMVLTAVVITMGVSALVLALAYRAWQLFGHDEVPDDVEDRRVLRRRRRGKRREQVRAGAAHAGVEGPEDEHGDVPEEVDHVPGAGTLPEEHRHGALSRSQGAPPPAGDGEERDEETAEDPVGADLSSEEDAPLDHTESDEDEEDAR